MPGLPVSMFIAIVFGYLAVRVLVVRDRPVIFALLLGAIAVQSVIISWRIFLPLQPVTAAVLPPLAWIVFQVSAVRAFDPARDSWHLAAPAFSLFVVLTAPMLLDIVIPAIFIAYALALLVRLRRGVDSLPRLSLATGERPGLVWRLVALALLLSAFGDIAIGLAMMEGAAWLKPYVLMALTAGDLLAIGLLSLSSALVAPSSASPEDGEGAAEAPLAVMAADAALMGRLDDLMTRDQLYLDPDLTLARIARRLTLPAKQVSAAVNRVTGENVSRLVNGYRVRNAACLLTEGENVTRAMLASGFNTKSNFNREFLRVMGLSPSQWLAASRGGRADRLAGPERLRVVMPDVPSPQVAVRQA